MRTPWPVKAMLAFGVLLWLAGLVFGQWGGGGCPPMGAVAPAVAAPAFEGWKPHPDDASRSVYFRGGAPVGVLFPDGSYRAWDSRRGAWLDWREAPAGAPVAVGQKPPAKNFGMGWSPDEGRPERYYVNGSEVDRRRAYEAIGAGVPDDSKLLRLTVIGTDAECRQVAGALESAPELAPYRGSVVLQCYRPDHWAVADSGFKRDGKPTLYVQAPSGKVLHRQDDWRGPAKLAEAIRKAQPDYDPKKDPDLNKQAPAPPAPGPDLDVLRKVPPWGWGVLIAVAVLGFFWIKEKGVAHVR